MEDEEKIQLKPQIYNNNADIFINKIDEIIDNVTYQILWRTWFWEDASMKSYERW